MRFLRVLAATLACACCLSQASAQTRVTVEEGVVLIQPTNTCWVEGSAFLKGSAPKGCPPWEAKAVADGCTDKACDTAKDRAVDSLKKTLTDKGYPQCAASVMARSTCYKSDDCRNGKCGTRK